MTAGMLLAAFALDKVKGDDLPWWIWVTVVVELILLLPGAILMVIRIIKAILVT